MRTKTRPKAAAKKSSGVAFRQQRSAGVESESLSKKPATKKTTAIAAPEIVNIARAAAKTSAMTQKAKAKATTIRLDPFIEIGLQLLQSKIKRPINKIVHDALADYIERGTADMEADIEDTLSRLRHYRRSDPGFKRAIAAFVDAEATHGSRDPVEGRTLSEAPGPAVSMIRERLRG